MEIIVILFLLFILSWFLPAPKWFQEQKRKEKLFAQKPLSEKQKYNLVRAELCLKRNTNRIPKNDVLWNVYQMDCTEYLAKELWDDYRKIRYKMGELLFEEKKYKGAIEYLMEELYWRMCNPCSLRGYGQQFPAQTFSDRKSILEGTYCAIPIILAHCIVEAQLKASEVKDIFFAILIYDAPFPITREEAWEIIEDKLDNFIQKYYKKYYKEYKRMSD